MRGGARCSGKEDIEVGPIVARDSCADLGQRIYGPFLKNGSLLAGFGLQEGRTCAFDVNHLFNLTDFEGRVHGDYRYLQYNRAMRDLLESGLGESQVVIPRTRRNGIVDPVAVGDEIFSLTRINIG